jgi:uncharacterized protein YidB (DUF937 family)
VKGVVEEFQKKGFGPAVQSWVGTGENQPISSEQVHQALGSDTVRELASKLGIPPEEMASKLADILPKAIDKMTPEGTVH